MDVSGRKENLADKNFHTLEESVFQRCFRDKALGQACMLKDCSSSTLSTGEGLGVTAGGKGLLGDCLQGTFALHLHRPLLIGCRFIEDDGCIGKVGWGRRWWEYTGQVRAYPKRPLDPRLTEEEERNWGSSHFPLESSLQIATPLKQSAQLSPLCWPPGKTQSQHLEKTDSLCFPPILTHKSPAPRCFKPKSPNKRQMWRQVSFCLHHLLLLFVHNWFLTHRFLRVDSFTGDIT